MLRVKDGRSRDLIIARDYITHGLRERACELVDLDLGPRTDNEIEQRLRAEVQQERLTSIDRALLHEAGKDLIVSYNAHGASAQNIRLDLPKKVERLRPATRRGHMPYWLPHNHHN